MHNILIKIIHYNNINFHVQIRILEIKCEFSKLKHQLLHSINNFQIQISILRLKKIQDENVNFK